MQSQYRDDETHPRRGHEHESQHRHFGDIAGQASHGTRHKRIHLLAFCVTIHCLDHHFRRCKQACLRPRDRFWDIPVPKIDSAFDNLFVPQPSWSPSTAQQLRKLVAAPYLAPI
ncbi:hypothetical protein [Thiolapillus sp.]|uniref:hypothetical protein n=6 Tax=Thiolapillus sp. TaxID=2017437 RepID=UPI0025E610B8|nr:hypothetical protein [Thiolapillus sp.]